MEAVMELGLAECAAFSNGSTIASKGEPRTKYAKFFRRTRHLYEGFEPYADIGLVYSYWGHNPLGMGLRASQEVDPSVDLASRHRLLKVLMDRTLDDADLRPLKSLILCGHALELTDAQTAAIRRWLANGGRLFVYLPATTLNGAPWAQMLPQAAQWQPGTDVPGMGALTECRGFARGLRFSAFSKPEEHRLTLHVVNYNVSHGENPAQVTEVKDARVAFPLPAGVAVDSVKTYSPESDSAADLPFECRDGRLTLSLPAVRIYQVLEVVIRAK
jgi:hypothetical protein